MVGWMRENVDVLLGIYGRWFKEDRYERICITKNLSDVLDTCQIFYHCSADASKVAMPDETFDAICTINTMEHINKKDISTILKEGRRLLKRTGLAAHLIDHTDHWAKSDPRICSMHFLKFPDWLWRIIADNKFAYLNRLRVSEMLELFRESGMKIVGTDVTVDDRSVDYLKSARLPRRFKKMSLRDLATATSLITARPL
ncbi:MAG: class I SAM-dependent methyltransferase [Nitrospirae bacterium]|nr:class I SAM-dependent methyltransferase [Nitrospirota bacterium]